MKPIARVSALIMALMMLTLCVAPVETLAAPKPTRVSVASTKVTIDLADGNTYDVSYNVLPSGASQRVIWATKNKNIAVAKNGVITAKKTGSVYIGVRPYGVKRWTNILVKVIDSLAPTSITLPTNKQTLAVGGTYQLEPKILPSTASQDVGYRSSKTSVVTVSSSGLITAKKTGTALVRVYSKRKTSVSKLIKITVVKSIKPTKITITPATQLLNVGDTLTLNAAVTPSNAVSTVKWTTSDSSIAKVSSSGVVTALDEGTVKITATSTANSKVKTTRTLKITDPNLPKSVTIDQDDFYLAEGDTMTLTTTFMPSTARKDSTWKSSDSSVVSVSSAGKVTARKAGTATITVTATGTSLSDSVTITVLDATRTSVVPDKYVDDIADVKANLARIDAVRLSAYNELDALVAEGKITSANAKLRKNVLINAFASLRFPWYTEEKVTYWNASTSPYYYKPGRIYFGMPYIQCGNNQNYNNRRYNSAKALAEGYFDKASNGLYEMTSKRMSGKYVGCDCSSFVSMAIWGTSHSASYLNTLSMMRSSYYKTISGAANLMPGDTLVRRSGSSGHTIMFLYYVSADKAMIIENGNSTVSCKLISVSNYINSQRYVIRRATKLL